MTVRLQEFDHRASRYERPNQKWECGWARDGTPCRLGPDGAGRCPAAKQSECEPIKEGDRFVCTRPTLFGGPCTPGPLPDGSCCHPTPEQVVCQPRPTWRVRRGRLTIVSIIIGVAVTTLLLAGPWGHRFLSPGALTSAHAVVETGGVTMGVGDRSWLASLVDPGPDYCGDCHVDAGDPGGILQPVTDGACLECHIAEAHHPSRSSAPTLPMDLTDRIGTVHMSVACTSCHMEHRGRDHAISVVADTACVACHGALNDERRGMAFGAAHLTEPAAPSVLPPVYPTDTNTLLSFADRDAAGAHPEFDVLTEGRFDATPIKFNHHVHMNPTGTMKKNIKDLFDAMVAEGVPAPEIPIGMTLNEDGEPVKRLSCAACHEPDAGGRNFLPIRFERHCIRCHEGEKDVVGDGEYRRLGKGHGPEYESFMQATAAEVLLTRAAAAAAAAAKKAAADDAEDLGDEFRGDEDTEDAEADPWGDDDTEDAEADPWGDEDTGDAEADPWGDDDTGDAEADPWGDEDTGDAEADPWGDDDTGDGEDDGSGGKGDDVRPEEITSLLTRQLTEVLERVREQSITYCAKCHGEKNDPGFDPLEIAPPNIPVRWMPRAVFNHEVHRLEDCTHCHAQAAVLDRPDPDDHDDLFAEPKWTQWTQEIMLPGIDSCRECHAPEAAAGVNAVRHDCVLCHEYHAPAAPTVAGGAVPASDAAD